MSKISNATEEAQGNQAQSNLNRVQPKVKAQIDELAESDVKLVTKIYRKAQAQLKTQVEAKDPMVTALLAYIKDDFPLFKNAMAVWAEQDKTQTKADSLENASLAYANNDFPAFKLALKSHLDNVRAQIFAFTTRKEHSLVDNSSKVETAEKNRNQAQETIEPDSDTVIRYLRLRVKASDSSKKQLEAQLAEKDEIILGLSRKLETSKARENQLEKEKEELRSEYSEKNATSNAELERTANELRKANDRVGHLTFFSYSLKDKLVQAEAAQNDANHKLVSVLTEEVLRCKKVMMNQESEMAELKKIQKTMQKTEGEKTLMQGESQNFEDSEQPKEETAQTEQVQDGSVCKSLRLAMGTVELLKQQLEKVEMSLKRVELGSASNETEEIQQAEKDESDHDDYEIISH
ncbi:hypothetical protein CAEBREN_25898 [Caenorhabditis brenneri]|uniref:Uncharacterized protein n=1 Tax=Caenorhabditis brenneri TaxID=135651 RepID=G0NUC4_CAEBE|nr:hypothetical protein CAEBREN_25898 [Caenorhabditis brenneri]